MIRPTSVFVFLVLVSLVSAYFSGGIPPNLDPIPHRPKEIPYQLPPYQPPSPDVIYGLPNNFPMIWQRNRNKPSGPTPATPPQSTPALPSTGRPVETTETNSANFDFMYFGIGSLLVILAAL